MRSGLANAIHISISCSRDTEGIWKLYPATVGVIILIHISYVLWV